MRINSAEDVTGRMLEIIRNVDIHWPLDNSLSCVFLVNRH